MRWICIKFVPTDFLRTEKIQPAKILNSNFNHIRNRNLICIKFYESFSKLSGIDNLWSTQLGD